MRLRVGDRVPIVGYCVIVALTNLNFAGHPALRESAPYS